MSRARQLTLLDPLDNARLALRFPGTALHMLRDCIWWPGPKSFPRRLGLFLTNRCDFACAMCAVQDARGAGAGDLPFEVLKTVLAECSPYRPVVDLIGGQPLLYPHLTEAVREASQRKVLAVVTTNGLKLSQRAESLVHAELPLLQVSLDGWDEPSQRARGLVKGSFERLCKGIRAIQAARGERPFPIIRILTAITRMNHAHLDRIQAAVAALGIRNWGISNYFYLSRNAYERHQSFTLLNGLSGSVAAHAIQDGLYLTPTQVWELKSSLTRVQQQNRRLGLHIAYAWNIDLDAYYSPLDASRTLLCELPYTRLDIHTDGSIAACVSGKRIGQVGRNSIAEVWNGRRMAEYRHLYERTRPMPMCFRCCGLSQTIRFDRPTSI